MYKYTHTHTYVHIYTYTHTYVLTTSVSLRNPNTQVKHIPRVAQMMSGRVRIPTQSCIAHFKFMLKYK